MEILFTTTYIISLVGVIAGAFKLLSLDKFEMYSKEVMVFLILLTSFICHIYFGYLLTHGLPGIN